MTEQTWTDAVGERLVERTTPRHGVALLTLDRVGARNALSMEMMTAISAALQAAADDKDTSAIVLTGNGPVFSSGHDLKELTRHRHDVDGGRRFFETTMHTCSALMRDIVRHRVPVIAAVQGMATAAGCQLVASCDLAVAADTAGFATPGVNIGLFCATPMVALTRNMPRKRAMEMLLLGDAISAGDAEAFGLVNRVVSPDMVVAAAMDMAQAIVSKSAATVQLGKAAFVAHRGLSLDDAYEEMSRVMVTNLLAPQAAEGMAAFLEKRPPNWPC